MGSGVSKSTEEFELSFGAFLEAKVRRLCFAHRDAGRNLLRNPIHALAFLP